MQQSGPNDQDQPGYGQPGSYEPTSSRSGGQQPQYRQAPQFGDQTQYEGQPYQPQPYQSAPQPPKRTGRKVLLFGCLPVVAIVVILLIAAAVAGSKPSSTVNTTAANTSTDHPTTAAPTTPKAGIGSEINLKGEKSGDEIQVTVVKIADPDQSTDGFSSPAAGTRYVSVQFQILDNGSNAYQDDPMIDVSVKDAKGQSFQPDLMAQATAAGPQLDSSTNLAPGDKALGFATFDIPTGDKIATVQYALNAGMYGNTAEWTIQ